MRKIITNFIKPYFECQRNGIFEDIYILNFNKL